jgi:hypothetical protein
LYQIRSKQAICRAIGETSMKGALAKYGALPLTGTLSVQAFSMLLLDGQLGGNHFGP